MDRMWAASLDYPNRPDRLGLGADAAAKEFAAADPAAILGALVNSSKFPAEPLQVGAWKYEIAHLQEIAQALPEAHVFLEFTIPRIGRRADAIIVLKGVIYVLEYKVGQSSALSSDLDQAHGYALDLKHCSDQMASPNPSSATRLGCSMC